MSVFAIFLSFSHAYAHVGYVISEEDFAKNAGSDFGFLTSAITDNFADFMSATVITLLIVGLILFVRSRKAGKKYMSSAMAKLESYDELLPWIARLALGIALIGAGTAETLISPVMGHLSTFAMLEVFLGFFFLLGFLVAPVSLVAIGIFLYGIATNNYLFGNLDFLALAVSVFLLGSGRPGLDDILSINILKSTKNIKLVPLVLRIGLGVAFIYLGMYEKILNPHDSELVVTTYKLTEIIAVSPALWVVGAGLVECTLGLLLILGFETRLVSMIAFLVISLSFFYFKESVYSHVTLFSALSMLVITGGGKYSLDKHLEETNLIRQAPQ